MTSARFHWVPEPRRGDDPGAVAFWTDAAFFADADVEWVDVDSVITLARVLAEAGRAYLGGASGP